MKSNKIKVIRVLNSFYNKINVINTLKYKTSSNDQLRVEPWYVQQALNFITDTRCATKIYARTKSQ